MPFKSRNLKVQTFGSDYLHVETLEPLEYYDEETDQTITVPAGFRSDYGSIPRLLWALFPPHEYRPEYILHDYGCVNFSSSRLEWDDRLRRSLEEAGAPYIDTLLIYAAVRSDAMYKSIAA